MTAEQEAEIGRRMAIQAAKDMAAWRAHQKRGGLLTGPAEHASLRDVKHSSRVRN